MPQELSGDRALVKEQAAAEATKVAAGEAAKADEFALGVLFVHGIGLQVRGQTLAECGGAIYRWMEERFCAHHHGWQCAAAIGLEQRSREPDVEHIIEWRSHLEEWTSDGCVPEGFAFASDPNAARIVQIAQQLKCEPTLARVTLTNATLSDPKDPLAPAHAELVFQRLQPDGSVAEERWMLAESWWAETFSAPSFRDLARWSLRILPWTLGSHYAAHIRWRWFARPKVLRSETMTKPVHRQNRGPLRRAVNWCIWLSQFLASIIGLVIALLATYVLLAIVVLMLGIALIPVPQLRAVLLKLQMKIAALLGDSYVFLSRPIEAACIVDQVQRDLAWLGKRCRIVAAVAHSQGAAVTHEALRSNIPRNFKLLFTFGSGLKKLEQLRQLMASGATYRSSAAWTLVAFVLFAFSVGWFVLLLGEAIFEGRTTSFTALPVAYLIVTLLLLAAGIRDHLRGIDLPNLNRWTKRLVGTTSWLDCYASLDPVSNGILRNDAEMQDISCEVCNRANAVLDHTTYWSNRDHFVSLLVNFLAAEKVRVKAGLEPVPDLTIDDEELSRIANRRRWRVGFARAIVWVAIVSVMCVLIRNWQTSQDMMGYSAKEAWALLFASASAPATPSDFDKFWPVASLLAMVAILYGIAWSIWRRWDDAEMHAAVERFSSDSSSFWVIFILIAQSLLAAGIASGAFSSSPLGLSLLWGIPLLGIPVVSLILRQPFPYKGKDRITPAVQMAIGAMVFNQMVRAALPFSVFLTLSWFVVALTKLGRDLSAREQFLTIAGAAIAAALLRAISLARGFRKRRRVVADKPVKPSLRF